MSAVRVTARHVLEAAAHAAGVSAEAMAAPRAPGEDRALDGWRHAAWVAGRAAGLSFPALAEAFGRHHTTIMAGEARAALREREAAERILRGARTLAALQAAEDARAALRRLAQEARGAA